ncbi:UNVERIFIED_CONTAM: hypothetical protein K2H54_052865 [Gekko kuhli]
MADSNLGGLLCIKCPKNWPASRKGYIISLLLAAFACLFASCMQFLKRRGSCRHGAPPSPQPEAAHPGSTTSSSNTCETGLLRNQPVNDSFTAALAVPPSS